MTSTQRFSARPRTIAALALVASLAAAPAVGADLKIASASRQATTVKTDKTNPAKGRASQAKPAPEQPAILADYQLERDGCCYGMSRP